jgi:Domain of unknown function (DUF1917)
MFFVPEDEAPKMWGIIAHAVANGRLGIAAKVAPTGETRLICVYTRDFTDKTDVARVLQELAALGLIKQPNRTIYYKSDAYTALDITRDNKYGLRASLYSSRDFPLPKKTAQRRPLDSEAQTKLDDWTL